MFRRHCSKFTRMDSSLCCMDPTALTRVSTLHHQKDTQTSLRHTPRSTNKHPSCRGPYPLGHQIECLEVLDQIRQHRPMQDKSGLTSQEIHRFTGPVTVPISRPPRRLWFRPHLIPRHCRPVHRASQHGHNRSWLSRQVTAHLSLLRPTRHFPRIQRTNAGSINRNSR